MQKIYKNGRKLFIAKLKSKLFTNIYISLFISARYHELKKMKILGPIWRVKKFIYQVEFYTIAAEYNRKHLHMIVWELYCALLLKWFFNFNKERYIYLKKFNLSFNWLYKFKICVEVSAMMSTYWQFDIINWQSICL